MLGDRHKIWGVLSRMKRIWVLVALPSLAKFNRFPVSLRNVKCTLVQALRLCTGRTAHRGSRGIALLFLDHGTRRDWGISVTTRPLFTSGNDPVPIVREAAWAPGPVWTGAENLVPNGIRSPDRPNRSHSLYQLRYPAHCFINTHNDKSSTRWENQSEYTWCLFAAQKSWAFLIAKLLFSNESTYTNKTFDIIILWTETWRI